MATLYRWYILDMDVVPTLGIYTDVVTRVGWRYSAINESGTTANLFGHTQLPPPPCQCYYRTVNITSTDLLSASGNTDNPSYDGRVFLSYINGNNEQTLQAFTLPGTRTDILPCCDVLQMYYYQGDTMITDVTSSYTTGGVGPQTPPDPGFVYTSYPDLTQEQVIVWVETYSDVPSLQENLNNQIYEKENPVIVNLPIPWE